MATSITWAHSNATGDANGIAVVALELPASLVASGAFAEPRQGATGGGSSHLSCTPTTFTDHSDVRTPLVGTFPSVVVDVVTLNFLFKTAPGQVIRAHVWTVTTA